MVELTEADIYKYFMGNHTEKDMILAEKTPCFESGKKKQFALKYLKDSPPPLLHSYRRFFTITPKGLFVEAYKTNEPMISEFSEKYFARSKNVLSDRGLSATLFNEIYALPINSKSQDLANLARTFLKE